MTSSLGEKIIMDREERGIRVQAVTVARRKVDAYRAKNTVNVATGRMSFKEYEQGIIERVEAERKAAALLREWDLANDKRRFDR
jgi:hypothetical protein